MKNKNDQRNSPEKAYSDVSETNLNRNWAYGVITAIWRI